MRKMYKNILLFCSYLMSTMLFTPSVAVADWKHELLSSHADSNYFPVLVHCPYMGINKGVVVQIRPHRIPFMGYTYAEYGCCEDGELLDISKITPDNMGLRRHWSSMDCEKKGKYLYCGNNMRIDYYPYDYGDPDPKRGLPARKAKYRITFNYTGKGITHECTSWSRRLY